MRSYEVARKTFAAIEFVGWSLVVVGLFAALALAGSVSQYAPAGAGFVAMVPGFAASVVGLVLVGHAQYWRAGVDSAEYSQQSLKIARENLEISRQALRSSTPQFEGFAAATVQKSQDDDAGGASFAQMTAHQMEANPSGTTGASAPEPDTELTSPSKKSLIANGQENGELVHEGQIITVRNGVFSVGSLRFNNLDAAQKHAENQKHVSPSRRIE